MGWDGRGGLELHIGAVCGGNMSVPEKKAGFYLIDGRLSVVFGNRGSYVRLVDLCNIV